MGRRGGMVARQQGGADRLGRSTAWLPAAEKRAERRTGGAAAEMEEQGATGLGVVRAARKSDVQKA